MTYLVNERCAHGGFASGRFEYSDGSWHPCCERHASELRGLAHGPGRFIPWKAKWL